MAGRICELALLLLGLALGSQEALPPPCESQIYCFGELLHQVQMAKLYPDDKEFVDMPLSTAPDQVLRNFDRLVEAHNYSIPREQLQAFVHQHFQAKGQELQAWTPGDWKDSPKFLQKISDPKLRAWAGQLNQIWKKLGKKMKPEVLSHPERFSLIYSKQPFIVPGGRFVEFYYWDSYWVMEGLLLSEMAETVKGMLQNFLDLVQTYGHIPNGGRVYYLQRSQPPLLTLMMHLYLTHTGDIAFLRENIETLALELNFWAQNRSISVDIEGQSYVLNRYYVPYGGPRPESYSKDTELADTLPEAARELLWAELKAGAESGWDFSSRWLVGGPNPNALSSIRTSRLVPVDLNAFLCQAEALMSTFYTTLGSCHSTPSEIGESTQQCPPEHGLGTGPGLGRPFAQKISEARDLTGWVRPLGPRDFSAHAKANNQAKAQEGSAWLPSDSSAAPGEQAQAAKYRNLHAQREAALRAVLWDEEKGAWFDYDIENRKKNHEFYPSNLTPLWAGCFSDPGDVDKALKYLEDNQILNYQHGIPTSLRNTGQQWDFPNAWAPLQDLIIRAGLWIGALGRELLAPGPLFPPWGLSLPGDNQILNYQHGIPTSLRNTGQQWDFPNAWAPLQDLIIRGLAKSSSPRTQQVAFQLAQNWIRTNFDVYSQKSAMYEKYDISSGGQPGGGGEYEVQEGFGWTNGVVLILLDRYGDQLTSGTSLASLAPHCLGVVLLLSLLSW
ncbi:Trehalase [Tupaia chinensis]|uniref:Trehalase n=1 Tax=Tupaia chinensis TaxID=246437 RepID=L9KKC6_TUPCH|nr:Trehalase [Tupaia chinensis]